MSRSRFLLEHLERLIVAGLVGAAAIGALYQAAVTLEARL